MRAPKQSNDLIFMLILGFAYHVIHTHLYPMNLHQQLAGFFAVSFVAGLFLRQSGQIFEWALFFIIGACTSATMPFVQAIIENPSFDYYTLVPVYKGTISALLLPLATWLIGAPMGYKMFGEVLREYWRQRTVYS